MNKTSSSRGPVVHCVNRSVRVRPFLFALAAATAGFCSPLGAQTTITIVNPSFESPAHSGNPDFTIGATGWTLINGTPAGTYDPAFLGTTPAPIDGLLWGFANSSGGLQQVLSDVFAVNQTYSFSVYLGNRSDASGSATGTVTLGYFSLGTFTPLSAQSGTIGIGNFNQVTGSFQTGGAEIGQFIAVQLTNPASNQVLFDQTQLSYTASAIPEPRTVAGLLGAAALGAAWWRRRNSARTALPPATA
jgi:hypothetical protein